MSFFFALAGEWRILTTVLAALPQSTGFEIAPQSDRRSRGGGKARSADFAIGESRKPYDMQGFRLGAMQACGLMISNASH